MQLWGCAIYFDGYTGSTNSYIDADCYHYGQYSNEKHSSLRGMHINGEPRSCGSYGSCTWRTDAAAVHAGDTRSLDAGLTDSTYSE